MMKVENIETLKEFNELNESEQDFYIILSTKTCEPCKKLIEDIEELGEDKYEDLDIKTYYTNNVKIHNKVGNIIGEGVMMYPLVVLIEGGSNEGTVMTRTYNGSVAEQLMNWYRENKK